MKIIRSAISYFLFPVVFLGAMFGVVWGMNRGVNEGLLLAIVAFGTAAITFIFEFIHPKHLNWNVPKNDVITDLLHAAVSMIALPQLIDGLIRAGLLVGAVALTKFVGVSIWPEQWPLVFQLLLAMTISQFGEYWIHRWAHEVPFLWRFHSVHHSPKRLYWLNAARFHPIETALTYTISVTSILLLGAPPIIITLFTVWATVHGLFQHCNIDVRLGFLNYIFSMAELHRWHHSLKLEEANSNYGNNIILWDIVFGTMYYPKDKAADENIGLMDMPDFPQNYIGQILIPFKRKFE